MAFTSFKLCVFLCLWLNSSAFLLDTSTPARVGHIMTDDHYESLLKLFMDEHNARIQLQQEVVLQQQQIAAMTGLQLRIERLESTTASIDKKTNSTVDIYEKYLNLEKKYEFVLQKQVQLKDDLNISRNRTTELEKEVESLKHIQTINQLQTLSTLQQEVQTIHQNVNSLTITSQARGQDLTSIYNDIVQNKQKLTSFVNATTTINHKLANSDNRHMSLMRDFNIFRKTQSNMTSNLINKQQELNIQMKNVTSELSDEKEFVGLTASGKGSSTRSQGYQLRFPVIKFAVGISNLSSMKNDGTFICEKKGMYLILVTVMVCKSVDSGFEIVKNNHQLISYYIGRSTPVSDDCYSGTGTAVIKLDVHDAINVKYLYSSGTMYEDHATFSAVKLQ